MSVLDEVRTFEQNVVERLRELEPLLREYEQLRALAQRLDLGYTPGVEVDSPAAEPAQARAARASKAASVRPGQRSDDVLKAVGEQPGITVREIGERIGVDPTGLYRVANKLTADGRLRRDGPRLHLAEPPASTDPTPGEATEGPPARARAKARAGKPAAEAKRAAPRRARAPRSARPGRPADEAVMRIVAEEPGITVPGLSERLKVNRPDLYRVTTALTKQGRLRTEGPKLYLAATGARD